MNIKKHAKKIIFALIVAAVIVAFVAYKGKDDKVQYLTQKVEYGDISETVQASGKLHAYKEVEVGAQVSGEISELKVEIGDTVKKGDLIAQIDPRLASNQLKTARATLDSNKAALLSRQASLTQAQQQYNRQKAMFAEGATSKEALETAEANYKTALAAVDQAKMQIKQAEVSIETAELNMGYTKLVAPMDGTVIAVPAEEGQTLNAGMNTPTVIKLAQLDKMKIKAEIAEADVSRVRPDMKAYFTLLGADDGKRYETTLKSIDPAPREISNNGNVSDTTAIYYYGQLEVPNENGELRTHMTANVHFVVNEKERVLKVPSSAVRGRGGKKTVEVLVNGKPERREVETGIKDDVSIEIVSGLKEGEEIVIGRTGMTGQMPNGFGQGGFNSGGPRRR
ncbi:MAG: efflux RND transporter periplasmic adaptor subunit [Neisseriaceae bacterium]|nr:efflux RND transporter periplasmic adaptor subunit [Neisseriaceae bacterium]